ncbi:MAG: S-methyl-5-thioribose-1-phosphate isomerase [Candidatus Omnitrophica bacterium]|nr:S-methyl-5-thioribose-1-phosphate isomerase [Candidatus Omnitrophota bacterium]
MAIPTIKWANNCVRIIDQTKLPGKLTFINCKDIQTLWKAIKVLSVRGAPALGAAAGFGVLLGIQKIKTNSRNIFEKKFFKVCDYIATSRPTAVNLFNELERMKNVVIDNPKDTVLQLRKKLKHQAFEIFERDKRVCRKIGGHGSKLIRNGSRLLTVCNAGALATVDYGTALGVMYSAKEKKKKFKVYACETRPLLQGARLTAWELLREKIDTTLICDNMAATLMSQGEIDMIFVGADRIALNGDVANKIGTYSLAVLANYHKVPFYIVAPKSTFDTSIQTGKQIPIEQRGSKEITHIAKNQVAPKGVKIYNPAFDVTPYQLISGIVTEGGILRAPFKENISKLFKK